MTKTLSKRVSRWLDLAHGRGAFEVSGSLVGLSADAIADEIAREWDAVDRGRLEFHLGTSDAEPEDIEPIVQRWLDRNT